MQKIQKSNSKNKQYIIKINISLVMDNCQKLRYARGVAIVSQAWRVDK